MTGSRPYITQHWHWVCARARRSACAGRTSISKLGTLRVVVALQAISGKRQLVTPKTPRSRRTLPLPSALAQALKTHRTRQFEERCWPVRAGSEHGLVFTTTVGTPITREI